MFHTRLNRPTESRCKVVVKTLSTAEECMAQQAVLVPDLAAHKVVQVDGVEAAVKDELVLMLQVRDQMCVENLLHRNEFLWYFNSGAL